MARAGQTYSSERLALCAQRAQRCQAGRNDRSCPSPSSGGRLVQVEDPIAGECICTNIVDEKDGWDDAVAAGLTGTESDELASCFTELVKNPDLPKRIEAVAALSKIPARVFLARFRGVSGGSGGRRRRSANRISARRATTQLPLSQLY